MYVIVWQRNIFELFSIALKNIVSALSMAASRLSWFVIVCGVLYLAILPAALNDGNKALSHLLWEVWLLILKERVSLQKRGLLIYSLCRVCKCLFNLFICMLSAANIYKQVHWRFFLTNKLSATQRQWNNRKFQTHQYLQRTFG